MRTFRFVSTCAAAVLTCAALAACQPSPPSGYQGYVEGEFVLLAPIEVAQVETVEVRRGDRVAPGNPIVHLEKADAEIAVTQAQSAVLRAQAQLADLKIGKRPEEIAVLEASLQSALAEQAEAARVLTRQSDLLERGTATRADYDRAQTATQTTRTTTQVA